MPIADKTTGVFMGCFLIGYIKFRIYSYKSGKALKIQFESSALRKVQDYKNTQLANQAAWPL